MALDQMSDTQLLGVLRKQLLRIGVEIAIIEPGQTVRTFLVEAGLQNRIVTDQLRTGKPILIETSFDGGRQFRNRPILGISAVAEEPVVHPHCYRQIAEELAQVAVAIGNVGRYCPVSFSSAAKSLVFLPVGSARNSAS